MLHSKHESPKPARYLPAILGILLLALFLWEEHKPYEILHSTIMSSPDLTETRMAIVVHSLLPIHEETLAKEIIESHQKLNGRHPNPYFELELYRTMLHYQLQTPYDTILCDESGQIVTEISLPD